MKGNGSVCSEDHTLLDGKKMMDMFFCSLTILYIFSKPIL